MEKKESVSHYLLDCPNYENERDKMRKRLFDYCGITHFDLNMLLDAKQEDDFKEWRKTIISELETYVVETRRFATRKSCLIGPPRTTKYRELVSKKIPELRKYQRGYMDFKLLYGNTEVLID